jgi:hypothetical protein
MYPVESKSGVGVMFYMRFSTTLYQLQLKWGPVASFCEYRDEPSGSVKSENSFTAQESFYIM